LKGKPSSILQQIIDTLLMLEEEREKDKSNFIAHQKIVKMWSDKHKDKENNFEVGDLFLKWDRANEPKGKHSKFQNLWLGPFQVAENIGSCWSYLLLHTHLGFIFPKVFICLLVIISHYLVSYILG
jgi:hypothetical protein